MNLINRFGHFVLRGRLQSVLMVILFSIVPFLGWISVTIITLVTLSKGPLEGILLVLWGTLPYLIFLAQGVWYPLLINVFFGSFFAFLFSVLLRRYKNWALILSIMGFLNLVAITGLHLWYPDLGAWMVQKIQLWMTVNAQNTLATLPPNLFNQMLAALSPFLLGFTLMFIFLNTIIQLMLGRAWQSTLAHLTLWKKEWLAMRMPIYSLIFVIVMIVLWFASYQAIVKDLLPVLMGLFLLTGMSLGHSVLIFSKAPTWIANLYYIIILLGVAFFPYTIGGILIAIALLDSLFNFRARFHMRLS